MTYRSFQSAHLLIMADIISQRYDAVSSALKSLAAASLPDQIGPAIETASNIMSDLSKDAQALADKTTWKLMDVMVRTAFRLPQILDQCCQREHTQMPTSSLRLLITFQRLSR